MSNLDNIAVGDKLVVRENRVSGGALNVVTVTRTTATKVVASDGRAYIRRSGRRYGDGDSLWRYACAEPYTTEVEVEIAEFRMAERCRALTSKLRGVTVTPATVGAAEALLVAVAAAAKRPAA